MKSNEKEKGREEELTGKELARNNTKESKKGLEIGGKIAVNNNEMLKEPGIEKEGKITVFQTNIVLVTAQHRVLVMKTSNHFVCDTKSLG